MQLIENRNGFYKGGGENNCKFTPVSRFICGWILYFFKIRYYSFVFPREGNLGK